MIFSCSKCGTRHQLPDEQVAHRVLKVRCTGCSAIVVVRDPASRPVGAQAWYVAVHGQQRGPLGVDEVARLLAEGTLTARSYAWCAGMPAWAKVAEIPDLAAWALHDDAAVVVASPGGATTRPEERPANAVAAHQAAAVEAARQAAADEAARQAVIEEAARQVASDEAARQAAIEEVALRTKIAEAARQAALEEAAHQAAIAEAARQAALAETALQAAIAEATRQAVLEEAALQAALDEAARQAAADEAALQAAIEEASQQAALDEAARQAAAAEAARQAALEEAALQAALEKAALQAALDEVARQAAADEAARQAALEEVARQAAADEAARQAALEEVARQAAADEAARQAAADEAARQAAADEAAFQALLDEEEAANRARREDEAALQAAAEADSARQLAEAERRATAEAAGQLAARKAEDEARRAAIAGALERAADRDAKAISMVPPPLPLPPPIPLGPARTPRAPAPSALAAAPVPADEATGLSSLMDEDAEHAEHAELAFFSREPAPYPEPHGYPVDDIFAAVDEPSAADKEYFKQAMREAPSTAFKDKKPSRIEMNALRQEFSVVAHLERTKNRSWVYGAIGLAAVAVLVVGVVIYQQEQRDTSEQEVADRMGDTPLGVYAERKLYATPPRELPELAVVEPVDAAAGQPVGPAVGVTATKHSATSKAGTAARAATTTTPGEEIVVRHKTFVATADRKAADRAERFRSMTPEQFRAMTEDEIGKGEVKVNFDARAVQDAAAQEAASKAEVAENERAGAVADTFGKKRRLFAGCAGAEQERVKVVFTVLPNGNVSEVSILNTKSPAKAECLEKILGRSIFPKGTTLQTYSQTLVL